ncbi:uncharacterized protein [Amphiura filiformis]|uniref:uncharacterized protein n=1 Tax=Amphiura filiformis TaxID=82378 RepID=UPI003B2264E2
MAELSGTKTNDIWHQCLVSCLAIFTFLILIVVTFIASYSGIPDDQLNLGIFQTDSLYARDDGDLFTEFQPAAFTFYIIWPIIFLFQWAWMIYVLTSLCRRNQYGPVFVSPPVVSPFVLWVYCVAIVMVTTWLFLFDQRLLVGAFVVLAISTFLFLLTLISLHRSVDNFGMELQQCHKRDLWAIRILIQNGIMLFFTWITVATHLALGSVMSYVGSVPQDITSTILLAMLGTIMLVYFFLENFIWERYLRYTYTFWTTVVWALLGIFVENWGLSRNAMITLFLLLIAGILGLIKLALSIMRTRSNPLYVQHVESNESTGSEKS